MSSDVDEMSANSLYVNHGLDSEVEDVSAWQYPVDILPFLLLSSILTVNFECQRSTDIFIVWR
jgi:hypothetical protein